MVFKTKVLHFKIENTLNYEQSLFFLGPSSKTPETRKCLASRSFAAQRSRARPLPFLNLKKKRDCSQSKNTPIKDTNGKRKFKRMFSFLFVDKRHFPLSYSVLKLRSVLLIANQIKQVSYSHIKNMVLSMFLRLVLANSLFCLRDINLTLGLLPPRRHVVWRDSVGVESSSSGLKIGVRGYFSLELSLFVAPY